MLLFGEYSLISGSRALTLPFVSYGAALVIPANTHSLSLPMKESNRQLGLFCDYLETLVSDPGTSADPLLLSFNLAQFRSDLSRGLWLKSNIPSGYGLGSSGALVACIYNRYFDQTSDLALLKNLFSRMESFFHGRSSGIDPLSCHAGQPLLFNENAGIHNVQFPLTTPRVYLADTGLTGKTGPLVGMFLEKLKDRWFSEKIKQEYIPSNDACIQALLSGFRDDFRESVFELSRMQYELFRHLIPEAFRDFWQQGYLSSRYAVKLCGSGGGGYLLVFPFDVEMNAVWPSGLPLLEVTL